jgi:parallel beta-helix repeat protein
VLLGTSSIPLTAQYTEMPAGSMSRGDWLYVGGSGPGNYSTIQDAINHASWGDTVFVYNGVYNEHIIIPKPLFLLGESRNATIITTTSFADSLISLKSDNITLSECTLSCSEDPGPNYLISCPSQMDYNHIIISHNLLYANTSFGIRLLNCHFCTITDNLIYTNSSAIELLESDNCVVAANLITATDGCFGIVLRKSSYNRIMNNTIEGGAPHGLGITLNFADFNTISTNTLYNHSRAIYIDSSSNLTLLSNHIDTPVSSSLSILGYMGIQITDGYGFHIQGNFISHCQFGIFLEEIWDITVSMNTFMKNIVHARFFNLGAYTNTWDQNYWGRPRVLPKPIFGLKYLYTIYPGFVVFDWHPAKEPFKSSID